MKIKIKNEKKNRKNKTKQSKEKCSIKPMQRGTPTWAGPSLIDPSAPVRSLRNDPYFAPKAPNRESFRLSPHQLTTLVVTRVVTTRVCNKKE